jgi:crossover junction endodeoxyribonuclease RuvC
VVRREGSSLHPVAHGTLRTRPAAHHAERLLALHRGVLRLLEDHAVEHAAIEAWFVHPPSRSAMGMAEARGALLCAVASAGLAVTEYAPTQVKQAVTGHGRAGKAQVRAMVSRILGVDPGGDHAADAMAACICHLQSAPLAAAVRAAGSRRR